jgi:hypothetical protein
MQNPRPLPDVRPHLPAGDIQACADVCRRCVPLSTSPEGRGVAAPTPAPMVEGAITNRLCSTCSGQHLAAGAAEVTQPTMNLAALA